MLRTCFLLLGIASLTAASEPSYVTAPQLAAQLAEAVEDGDATVRTRLKTADGTVLQLQIKSRRSKDASIVAYEVLWPKERRGERVVLRQRGTVAPEGTFRPVNGEPQSLSGAGLMEPLFGSSLAYRDVIENFYRWPRQSLAGHEKIGTVDCVILESRPGDASSYGKVRSWIDLRRMIPLRVEKFDRQDRLVRRFETSQVARDDIGRHVPAGLTVQRAGDDGVTEIDGSSIRHDVRHTDEDFAP